MAATTSYRIRLGHTLAKTDGKRATSPSGPSSFVSVKYNFMPPSIDQSSSAYLHSTKEDNSQWMLEYDVKKDEDRRGTRSSAQGFQGSQGAAKEYDCVLVWDEASQSYVLDRLSSTFTFKYDRGHSKLSEAAKKGLIDSTATSRMQSDSVEQSALGLNLADSTPVASTSLLEGEDHEMTLAEDADGAIDEGYDDDTFARQLELGLEGIATDEQGKDSSMEVRDTPSPPKGTMGLGITQVSALQESSMTPRGSPYIDRPKVPQDAGKTALNQNRVPLSSQILASSTARSTPVVSPRSLANSPRPSGFDSALPSSSSWKPPPQRSNVAIAYDEDEDDGDDESDDEEDDDDEEDEEDEEVDLDAYARQLESSLQG